MAPCFPNLCERQSEAVSFEATCYSPNTGKIRGWMHTTASFAAIAKRNNFTPAMKRTSVIQTAD